MFKIGVEEASGQLKALLKRVAAGEEVILVEQDREVAGGCTTGASNAATMVIPGATVSRVSARSRGIFKCDSYGNTSRGARLIYLDASVNSTNNGG